jgi:hypothetical protein
MSPRSWQIDLPAEALPPGAGSFDRRAEVALVVDDGSGDTLNGMVETTAELETTVEVIARERVVPAAVRR